MRSSVILVVLFLIARASAGASLTPGIFNPGFEDGAGGWGWQVNNGCRVRYHVQSANPHSGKQCIAFANESGVAPNVFGRLSQTIGVLPDTEYELSVWARGEDVSTGGAACHFTDWGTYTLNLPTGTFGWQKVSTAFKTKPGQYTLTLGLNVVDSCKELAVDDISLQPIGEPLKGNGIDGSFLTPTKLIGHNAPGYLGIYLNCTSSKPVGVEAEITGGETVLFSKRARLVPGENKMEWEWDTGRSPFGELKCVVNVSDTDGRILASGSRKIASVDSPTAAEIDRAEARFRGEFMDLYNRCRARKIRLDYPSAAKTMLDQFIPLAREDVQKGHEWRAKGAAKDFRRALNESTTEMKAYLADPKLAPVVRRYQTGRNTIDGLSIIADRKDSNGKKDRGPAFFVGYGHFYQVREDMPKWPGYGVNIIQIEVGPAITLVSEDKVSLKAVDEVAKVLDDAAKYNVKVDVLLSPHYFPQWVFDKWPNLAKCGGHFLGYEVDAPEAKQVVEKFLRTVIPILKDKPALHSFCLSNEPVFNNTANGDWTKPKWATYLAKVHGSVKTMNERYGASYKSFEDVQIPGNESYDDPQFYDYCVFNQQRFAAWHKWMADIVHSMAPKVPVHSKMMSMALPHRFTISWGVDPELFGEFSDLNGNDCLICGPVGHGWFLPFHLQNMSYDLQRSLNRKPIFNSENHPTGDRATYYVAPEHFKTAFWQGAIHGQASTTTWVWERTDDRGSDLYGNVMDRPGCALATGTTCLDLNRFADEVTALQNVKAPVAIIFSIASICRSPKYQEVLYHAYCGLNFAGIKIDFISEKQLQEGKGKDYRMIILPQSTHVLPATFEAVKRLPPTTRLVILNDSLIKDPYGKDYPVDEVKAIRARSLCLSDGDPEKALWPAFEQELGRLKALPAVSVVNAATGRPVWGVEWLPVEYKGRTLINIVDLTDKPVDVKIVRSGKEVSARNLLSLGGREKVGMLKPGSPVLAKVSDGME